mgnify:CR=1 FL=1
MQRITVFGGSKPKPGESAYQQAYLLGQCLGEKGYTVLTGGYIGTMEAGSRGAAEKGGHVIGVTCEEIESWRPVRPNPWVMEEMRYPTLRARLYALIDECDAAIALPGGIGTLAEIAAMWSQLQIGVSSARPLLLIGNGWQAVFESMMASLGDYIAKKDGKLITHAVDVHQAVDLLQNLLKSS